jgi:hypothetical protein
VLRLAASRCRPGLASLAAERGSGARRLPLLLEPVELSAVVFETEILGWPDRLRAAGGRAKVARAARRNMCARGPTGPAAAAVALTITRHCTSC